MKVLGNLPFVKDSDAKYPFGANIQNETDTQDGTPVVRELYGDLVMNLYKLLELTNETPTDTEDNDDTQYQIVNALKKFANDINDSEKVLTLNGTVWECSLNLSILPDKFVFFARPSDAYNSLLSYTFKGSGVLTLPFTSTGFNASDELLIVIDSLGVRAYSLSMLSDSQAQVFTTLGTPLACNESGIMLYQEEGNLLSDTPSIELLESTIRVDQSDGTLIVNSIFVTNGYAVCVTVKPSDASYLKFFCFETTDFSTVIEFTANGGSFENTNNPFVYVENDEFYLTNDAGATANDYDIQKFIFDVSNQELVFVSSLAIDNTFIKTQNAAVKDGFLYTFVSGVLDKWDLTTGTKTNLGTFASVNGQIFRFNKSIYFGSGEVAQKWSL